MQTHILGFPSIGQRRELKQALESYWKGELAAESLLETGAELKKRHWQIQRDAGLDYVTTGDFSLYDRMLDVTCMLGAVPPRFEACRGDAPLDGYFSLARGDVRRNIPALEMTKWFDTNYHYLVPEIDSLPLHVVKGGSSIFHRHVAESQLHISVGDKGEPSDERQ